MEQKKLSILEMDIQDFVNKEIDSPAIRKRLINYLYIEGRTHKVKELWIPGVSHPLRHYRNIGLTAERYFENALAKYDLYFDDQIVDQVKAGIGTIKTQIVMDYDDFVSVLEEFVDKVVNKIKSLNAQPNKDDGKKLFTSQEVGELFSVTQKTLHVWHKTGFLPRIRIGGVVRYRREDIERAATIKGINK